MIVPRIPGDGQWPQVWIISEKIRNQGVLTAIWRRVESDAKAIQPISEQPTFHFCRLVTIGTSLIIDRVFFGEVSCFKFDLHREGWVLTF